MELLTLTFWSAYYISLYLLIFWLLVYLEKGTEEEHEPLTTYPAVTIAIPAHNEEKNIKETLEPLLKLNYPKQKITILVINNGSTDNTASITQQFINQHPDWNIQLINQQQPGKGKALNNALRHTTTPYFICLDADSRVEPDALITMLPACMDKHIGAVLPTLKVEQPTHWIQRIQWFEYTITFFFRKMMGHIDCAYVTPGPFALYRTATLKKIKGFDENNLTEDMELAFKLQAHNYKIIQLVNTVIYTKAPPTIYSFYRQRNRWYKGGLHNLIKYKHLLFRKNYGEFGMLQVPLMWISVLLSTIVFCFITYKNLIKPLWDKIYYLSFIHYQVHFSLHDFFSTGKILGIDYTSIFLLYTALLIMLLCARIAFRTHQEKMLHYKLRTPIIYFLLYPIAIFIIWLLVIKDLILRKWQPW